MTVECWVARRATAVAGPRGTVLRTAPEGAVAACCGGLCGRRGEGARAALLGLDDVPEGAEVDVAVSRASLTRVALICFGLPLMALLSGAWLGSVLALPLGLPAEAASGLAGLLLLLVCLAVITRCGARVARLLEVRVAVQPGTAASRTGGDPAP